MIAQKAAALFEIWRNRSSSHRGHWTQCREVPGRFNSVDPTTRKHEEELHKFAPGLRHQHPQTGRLTRDAGYAASRPSRSPETRQRSIRASVR